MKSEQNTERFTNIGSLSGDRSVTGKTVHLNACTTIGCRNAAGGRR